MHRSSRIGALAEKFGRSNFFASYDIKGISAKNARAFSSGKIAVFVRFISRLLAYTSTRVYGCAALTFGLLTLVLHLGEYYFKDNPKVDTTSLVIGVVFSLISIFLFISDKPMCIALQSFKITDYVFFEFFSIGRLQKSENEKNVPIVVGIIFGFLIALLGFFLPTLYVVLVIFGVLFVSVSMVSPELPFISSILIFPYITLIPKSDYLIAALVLLTLVSFFRKVFFGKRVYSLEIYDVLFLLLSLAVLLVGAVLGGSDSVKPTLLIVFFILGYTPAANMAVNRRLCDSVVSAVVASALPTSVYAIVTYVISIVNGNPTASSAWFSGSAMLAAYLAVVVLFSLYLFFEKKKKIKKVSSAIACALGILALISTEYLGLIIALFIGVLMFFIIRSRRIPKIFLAVLLLVPFLLLIIPVSVSKPVLDLFGMYETFLTLQSEASAAVSALVDNIFLGVGADAFGNYFSTYFGIACSFGILPTLLVVAILLLRIVHLDVYGKYFPSSLVGFHVEMTALAPLVMLLLGSFSDIFRDINMIYFFVLIFGIGTAALRISKKETDQRHGYYKDVRRLNSAAIDVTLK